jgi:hypothetical protein
MQRSVSVLGVFTLMMGLWAGTALAQTNVPGAILWTGLSTSNALGGAVWASATVNTNLDASVLVWDATDQGTSNISDWAASRLLGAQTNETVSGQMTNLSVDTAYTWRLYGTNAWPAEAWSDAVSFTTTLSSNQAPVFASATPTEWNTIALTWSDNATHETGYLLQRSTDGSNFMALVTLAPDTTAFSDSGAYEALTYHYRLSATNAANGSATDFALCTTSAAAPGPPAGTLLYESFERPVVGSATSLTAPTGWENLSPTGNRAGLGHLMGTAYVNMYGNQAGWLNVYNTEPVLQTTTNILSTNLLAEVRYTLSFDAAGASDYTIHADLLAGSNVVMTAQVNCTTTDFSNHQAEKSWIPKSGDQGIGETISVRLRVTYSGYPWNQQCYVDNLLLSAEHTSVDVSPPTPNPMDWAQLPVQTASNSVEMVSASATDLNFVEYYFTNTINGNVSGWQDSRRWTETGLTDGVAYTYRVKARDKSVNQNETGWSVPSSVTIDAGLLFYSSFEWPIVTGATTSTDPMGWVDVSPTGTRAGLGYLLPTTYSGYDDNQAAWLNVYNTEPVLETTSTLLDAPLEAFTEYTLTFDAASDTTSYTIHADLYAGSNLLTTASVNPTSRNFASHEASQIWVSPGSGPTIGETLRIRLRVTGGAWNVQSYVDNLTLTRASTAGDITPPTPDPLTWVQLPTPAANSGITMMATTATDPSLVAYFFTNTVNGNVSGWQDDRIWTETGLTDGVTYTYQMKARDKSASLNETSWSTAESATADASILLYDTFEDPIVTGRRSTMAPGWSGSDTRTGLWNEDSSTMSTPFGEQAMYVWNARYVTTTAAGLTNTLAATTTYTLSFNAAAESGNGGIDYDVELWAGSTILGAANGGPMTLSQFSNVSDRVVFTTGTTHPNLGDLLAIRLRYITGDWRWVMGYDNVKLTAVFDASAPTPNPMAFAIPPFGINSNAIAMVASNATDVSGPVQYYFENTNTAANSGWLTNTVWVNEGLTVGNTYAYRVKARDALGNETAWSAVASAMPQNETDAPQPDPMTFALLPQGVSATSIGMTATIAIDAWNNPVEYYFLNPSNGVNSGWISGTSWVNTNLTPGMTHYYRVKARDALGNETAFSLEATALPAGDVTPPNPNPMGFDVAPAAVDAFSISMTALNATDFSSPVQYYFLNTNTTVNSGWQTSRVWTNGGLATGLAYDYVVKARDAVSNETAWSAIATTIAEIPAVTIFAESFENPPHLDATGLAIAQVNSEGWVRSGTAGLMDEDSAFFVTFDGSQVAVLDDSATYTTTTNLTETLQANVMYTLSFNVASKNSGSVTYETELWAGSTIVGRVRGTVASFDTAVTSAEIRFTAPSDHAEIGQTLAIRLKHPDAGGGSNEAEIYYDNVLLTTRDTGADTEAPTPGPLTWVVPPAPVMNKGLTMVASELVDPNGVQYFFTNTINGAVSGWQDLFWWTESNLEDGATYSYRVKARDNSTNLNETAWSSVTNGTVDRFTIFSEGFEDPQVYRSTGMTCPGWANNGILLSESGGLMTTPFGMQVGDPSYLGSAARKIESTNITAVLLQDHAYTLTFNVGNVNVDNGAPRGDNRYVAELIAGSTVVTSVTAVTSTDDLSETGELVFTADKDHSNLGETLQLRFYMSAGDYHAHPLFDNLRLRAVPPPPPTAMFLIVR